MPVFSTDFELEYNSYIDSKDYRGYTSDLGKEVAFQMFEAGLRKQAAWAQRDRDQFHKINFDLRKENAKLTEARDALLKDLSLKNNELIDTKAEGNKLQAVRDRRDYDQLHAANVKLFQENSQLSERLNHAASIEPQIVPRLEADIARLQQDRDKLKVELRDMTGLRDYWRDTAISHDNQVDSLYKDLKIALDDNNKLQAQLATARKDIAEVEKQLDKAKPMQAAPKLKLHSFSSNSARRPIYFSQINSLYKTHNGITVLNGIKIREGFCDVVQKFNAEIVKERAMPYKHIELDGDELVSSSTNSKYLVTLTTMPTVNEVLFVNLIRDQYPNWEREAPLTISVPTAGLAQLKLADGSLISVSTSEWATIGYYPPPPPTEEEPAK